jgi:hypothetical protein
MTPKEKAIELTDSFYVLLDGNVTFEQVKQCALIAVEEILDEIQPFELAWEYQSKIEFWQEVKQEIEKL